MYDNYLSNTLLANRIFPTGSENTISVISIPSNLFGEYIKPGSFEFKYLQDTITQMYDYATEGVVLLLSSRMTSEGLVNHDPGRIFNWVQKKYQSVIIDHTISKSGFCLIIYK